MVGGGLAVVQFQLPGVVGRRILVDDLVKRLLRPRRSERLALGHACAGRVPVGDRDLLTLRASHGGRTVRSRRGHAGHGCIGSLRAGAPQLDGLRKFRGLPIVNPRIMAGRARERGEKKVTRMGGILGSGSKRPRSDVRWLAVSLEEDQNMKGSSAGYPVESVWRISQSSHPRRPG